MKLFEPSLQKMIFFLILFAIGCGFLSSPQGIVAPGRPGHYIEWGMFGITFGLTSDIIAELIFCGSILLIIISLIFLIVYFIKEFKK